jgi:hypothetical protein
MSNELTLQNIPEQMTTMATVRLKNWGGGVSFDFFFFFLISIAKFYRILLRDLDLKDAKKICNDSNMTLQFSINEKFLGFFFI